MTMLYKDGNVFKSAAEYMTELASKPTFFIQWMMDDAAYDLRVHPRGINAEYYAAEVAMCKAELACRMTKPLPEAMPDL